MKTIKKLFLILLLASSTSSFADIGAWQALSSTISFLGYVTKPITYPLKVTFGAFWFFFSDHILPVRQDYINAVGENFKDMFTYNANTISEQTKKTTARLKKEQSKARWIVRKLDETHESIAHSSADLTHIKATVNEKAYELEERSKTALQETIELRELIVMRQQAQQESIQKRINQQKRHKKKLSKLSQSIDNHEKEYKKYLKRNNKKLKKMQQTESDVQQKVETISQDVKSSSERYDYGSFIAHEIKDRLMVIENKIKKDHEKHSEEQKQIRNIAQQFHALQQQNRQFGERYTLLSKENKELKNELAATQNQLALERSMRKIAPDSCSSFSIGTLSLLSSPHSSMYTTKKIG
jgi:chromosome segregation ATPase